jgi:hypothetical protein
VKGGYVLACFDYLAGDVAAEDVRERYFADALANPEIEMIQRAGSNTNQNLILARLRVGDVFILKNL